jgi:hypothetical protein
MCIPHVVSSIIFAWLLAQAALIVRVSWHSHGYTSPSGASDGGIVFTVGTKLPLHLSSFRLKSFNQLGEFDQVFDPEARTRGRHLHERIWRL